jgi:single-strand DNA-binding protein
MQTIQIVGYLGRDAEIREFAGNPDKKFVVFSTAVSRKQKNGESKTTWYFCTIPHRENGKLAESLTKGKKVFVRGELSASVYMPADSIKGPQISLSISCDKIVFLDSPKGETQVAQEQAVVEAPAVPENVVPIDSDDLPF